MILCTTAKNLSHLIDSEMQRQVFNYKQTVVRAMRVPFLSINNAPCLCDWIKLESEGGDAELIFPSKLPIETVPCKEY